MPKKSECIRQGFDQDVVFLSLYLKNKIMTACFEPIGIIHTPFTTKEGMPIQPKFGEGIRGSIELYKEFEEGLLDLDGFSHLILIYHLHQSQGYQLEVTPFLDHLQHGVFATRAPRRPNAIGLSIVKLIEIKNNILIIENVDMLDQTPLLDIKPYIPLFDHYQEAKTGWLGAEPKEGKKFSDNRFS